MPTKDEKITNLEKEVESLREQLKYCKLVVEGKSPATPHGTTEALVVPVTKSTETSPKPQPEGQSETKEAKV